VKAAAINPSDIGDVAGRFKSSTLPRTPGRDFASIVVKGRHPECAEVWGSSRRCVSGNAVAQTAVVEYGSSRGIVSAAGAVGQAATQIANWKQARVIGADIIFGSIPGTESVVNTKTEDLRERVLELTAGKGVGKSARQRQVKTEAGAQFRLVRLNYEINQYSHVGR
jgi:NADPH:quinone reductase-like Zn-dependent oxidoreductase